MLAAHRAHVGEIGLQLSSTSLNAPPEPDAPLPAAAARAVVSRRVAAASAPAASAEAAQRAAIPLRLLSFRALKKRNFDPWQPWVRHRELQEGRAGKPGGAMHLFVVAGQMLGEGDQGWPYQWDGFGEGGAPVCPRHLP